MNTIRRQSILSFGIVYFGFALGFLNIYLFTREGGFTETQYGLTGTFIAIANVMFSFASLGMQAYIYKFYPYYNAYFSGHVPRRDLPRGVTPELYAERHASRGPIFVGSPQQIVDKVMYERELFGHDRFMGQLDLGGMPYAEVARMIELLARDVLPALRAL